MFLVVQLLVAIVIVVVSYWWFNLKKLERRLKWLPRVPGHPVYGNALDFKKSTEILDSMSKYLRQCGGTCLVDLVAIKLVIISDLKFVEFLLTTTKILDKSNQYRFLQKWLGDGLLTAKGPRWKKSRKIITPAFHFSILNQFIPIYDSNANVMVNLLEKEIGKDSVDIYPYVTMCTLDIICETSMGVSINAQLDRLSDYVFAVKEMCRITIDRSFSILKNIDLLYPLTKDFYKERKYLKTLHSHTESVIRSRKEELKNKKKDLEEGKTPKQNEEEELGVKKKVAFLDLLLQSTVDGEPLPDWYVREEVDTLMFEGHDTTGSALSFALFCLAENEKVQAQVVEELRVIFGKDKDRSLTSQDIQNMKYLELAIKETLRLYPSVPFYARNTDTDIEYNGNTIPKGTSLLMDVYELQRNPEFFPDPEKFDPSRFEKSDGKSPFTYLPFSAGPRNCIGQKFAMHVMKVVLSRVLLNYELLPTTPRHKPILAAEAVLKSVNGIKIRIKRRKWI